MSRLRAAPAIDDASRIVERAVLIDLFAQSGLAYVADELVEGTLDAVRAAALILPEVDPFKIACGLVAVVHVDLRERHRPR